MEVTEILELKFKSRDLRKTLTIRDYLKTLLLRLWEEEESFNGKRPFGNSGWQHEIYIALIKSKVIKGSLDEDGYILDFNKTAADKIVTKLIKGLQ